jgi:hypothetical protein
MISMARVLLRTGLRVGEYTALPHDAIVQIGPGHWLHVPVGKLREDRYLPLHPELVRLIGDYRRRWMPADTPWLITRPNGTPLDRHAITRHLNRAAAAAGLAHIHPHQLRHTLATQAVNRGMSLEAIAAMLGHKHLDQALRYAKIANRTVADEYFAVTDKVEALYGKGQSLPADAIGPRMAQLRRDHFRLLGNGYCTRRPELDCAFEAVCENCSFFVTGLEFLPILQPQHDRRGRQTTHRPPAGLRQAARRSRPGRAMTPRCHTPAFTHRCHFSPPAADVKTGRRPPEGPCLDTGEDGGSVSRRERPPTHSWSPSAASRQPRSNPHRDQLDKITHIMPPSLRAAAVLSGGPCGELASAAVALW